MTRIRHAPLMLALAAVLALALTATPARSLAVVGGGSSLAAPLYYDAIFAYMLSQSSTSTTTIQYAASSSGTGRTLLASGTLDFADSDSVLTGAFYQQYPDALCIPVLAAAIVPIYNLPSSPSLRLSQAALAKIFMGEIRWWNDSEIVDVNPDITLPNATIAVVVRSDNSGTTHIFTDALSSFYQPFNTTIGSGELVTWTAPVLVTAVGNEGVADTVVSIPYSISYISLNIATDRVIPFASVQNEAGAYISGSSAAVQYALYERAVLTLGSDSESILPGPSGNALSIVNPSAARAYSIAGFSYVVLLGNTTRNDTSCAYRAELLNFLLFFLYSDVVATLASNANFNTLPDLLRQALDLQAVLKSSIYCGDGTLAADYSTQAYGTVSSVSPGLGVVLAAPIMTRIATSYTSLVPAAQFPYTAANTADAITAVTQSSASYSYAVVLDDQLTAIQHALMIGVIQFPLALIPVLPVFKLAGIAGLSLTPELLGKIYGGAILYWNHSLIQSANPGVTMPALPIILTAVTPSASATNEATSIFVSSLFDRSPSFAACYNAQWRQSATTFIFRDQALSTCTAFNSTKWAYTLSEGSMQGLVSNTEGAIGFTLLSSPIEAQPIALNNASLDTAQLFHCLDSGGYSVDASTLAMHMYPRSSLSAACWPLTSSLSVILQAMHYDTNVAPGSEACASITNLAEFIVWQGDDSKGLLVSVAGLHGAHWLGNTSLPVPRDTYNLLYARLRCNGAAVLPMVTYEGTKLSLTQSVSIQCVSVLLCIVGSWVGLLLVEMVTMHTDYSKLVSLHCWLAITSVSLAVTSVWTAMVLTFSSLSIACPSCSANMNYNLLWVLLSAVLAVVPVYIGLTILHWNFVRVTARGQRVVTPADKEKPSMSADAKTQQWSQWLALTTVLRQELTTLYHSCTLLACVGSGFITGGIVIIRILLSESLQIDSVMVLYTNAAIASSAFVAWLLVTAAMVVFYHSHRWRLIGVLLIAVAVVIEYQAAFAAIDITYTPSWVASTTASVSSGTLILMASIIGACSGLIFVALQFNKLHVSHHALLKRSRALASQLQVADRQRKRDDRLQGALLQYISLVHHCLDAVNMGRPTDSSLCNNREVRIDGTIAQLLANSALFISGQMVETMGSKDRFSTVESIGADARPKASIPLVSSISTHKHSSSNHQVLSPSQSYNKAPSVSTPPVPAPRSLVVSRDSTTNTATGAVMKLSLDSPSLEAILSHPMTAELLKDVAQRLLSIENILFLIWLERYHRTSNAEHQQELASMILVNFIRDESDLQVNLSSKLRSAVVAQFEQRLNIRSHGPLMGVLEEARREVVTLVMTNVWTSFVQSSQYQQCGAILRASARMSERLRLTLVANTSVQ